MLGGRRRDLRDLDLLLLPIGALVVTLVLVLLGVAR